MEIGAENVLIVLADKKDSGELRLLGGGEARVRGMEKGEITHVGDLVESIADAADKARHSAGISIEKLYYNLDDPKVESVWPVGSKILDGEGEIQDADVQAGVQAAERLAGNFEKKVMYAAEIDYIIDDKDPVMDPIGIFGHKLDVKVHLLLAQAGRCDAWKRFLRRAGFSKTVPVLSGLSSAYGILNFQERQDKKIVWDLEKDYLTGLVLAAGRIQEYRSLLSGEAGWGHLSGVVLALCQDFQKKCPGVSEVILTGEFSKDERFFSELKSSLDIPVRSAVPQGMAKLSEPSHASIAGLLQLAGEIENKSVVMRPEKKTLTDAREKVRSFLSDYF